MKNLLMVLSLLFMISCQRTQNPTNSAYCSYPSNPAGVFFYLNDSLERNRCLTEPDHIEWFEDMINWGVVKPLNGYYIWDEFHVFKNVIGKTGDGKFQSAGELYRWKMWYDASRDVMMLGLMKDYNAIPGVDYGIVMEFGRQYPIDIRLGDKKIFRNLSVSLKYCNRDFSTPYTGPNTTVVDRQGSHCIIKGNDTGNREVIRLLHLDRPDFLIRSMTMEINRQGPLPYPNYYFNNHVYGGFDFITW